MTWNTLNIDYKEEEPPVEVCQHDSTITIKLDGGELRTSLRVPINSALEMADVIRPATGEKSFETLEDELLAKDKKIEELQNIIEQYEENNDAYRDKLMQSCNLF